jgi:uncharacterized protein YoxC
MMERSWSTKSLHDGSDVHAELDALRGMLTSLEQEKLGMQERMQGYLTEMKHWQAQHETSRNSLEREKQALRSSLDQVKDELKSRDKELEEYQELVDFLKLESADLRSTSAQNVEQVRHIREVEQGLKDSEEAREQLTRFFEEQLKRLEDRLDGLQKENAKIREDNSELTQTVRSLKKQLDGKLDQVQELEASRADISARLEDLERQLRNKDDGRIQDDLQRYLSLTDQLQQQLLQEMDSLKRRVALQPTPEVLKPRVVYEAIKGDEIDQNLAEYLNAKEPAVPVPFHREELGVYFFGTKKVFIKIEQGRIIIRVGGGYMTIDEFIDIYTPIELEKSTMPREAPTRERLISKIVSSIDGSSDFVTCVGLQRKSVSPSRRPRTPKSQL